MRAQSDYRKIGAQKAMKKKKRVTSRELPLSFVLTRNGGGSLRLPEHSGPNQNSAVASILSGAPILNVQSEIHAVSSLAQIR